ncbi:MAG: hypothetical protein KDD85_03375 [Parvularculaceae bacterium]|nr:hypothetical protein [Parvularculaceae bacterium]
MLTQTELAGFYGSASSAGPGLAALLLLVLVLLISTLQGAAMERAR